MSNTAVGVEDSNSSKDFVAIPPPPPPPTSMQSSVLAELHLKHLTGVKVSWFGVDKKKQQQMDVNMEVNVCVFSLTAHGVKSSALGTGNKPNQVLAFSQAEEDVLVHSSPYFYRYSVGVVVVVVDNPLCKIFIFAGFAKRKSNKFSEKEEEKKELSK
jgi:hypothetical protein